VRWFVMLCSGRQRGRSGSKEREEIVKFRARSRLYPQAAVHDKAVGAWTWLLSCGLVLSSSGRPHGRLGRTGSLRPPTIPQRRRVSRLQHSSAQCGRPDLDARSGWVFNRKQLLSAGRPLFFLILRSES
jgi:hypothetical protein